MTKEEFINKIKNSKEYKKCTSNIQRKKVMDNAMQTWKRREEKELRLKKRIEEIDNIYNESYEDIYLEGYYDALQYLLEIKDGNFDDPTKMRFFGMIGGGDLKGDMASLLGVSDKDSIKIKAMQYAMEKGETFKEPFISGNGKYGHKDGKLYRENGIFPGGRVTSTIRYNDYSTFTDGTGMTHTIKTGSHTIPDETRYLDMYRHLKPKDRDRILNQYKKYKKIK